VVIVDFTFSVLFFFTVRGELSRAAIVGDFPELSRTAATVSFASLEPSGTDGDHIKAEQSLAGENFRQKKKNEINITDSKLK